MIFIFSLGCTKSEIEPTVSEQLPCNWVQYDGEIDKLVSSDSMPLGETDTIIVYFWGGNDGCAVPIGLSHRQSDTLVVFNAYYRYPEVNCELFCAQNIPYHKLGALFHPDHKGIYLLQSNSKEISTTIKVY